MMEKNSRYIFIFNPAADKGRARFKADWLATLIAERGNSVMRTTAYPGHAGEIARSGTSQASCLIACGGDGTLHEVVNAVAGEPVTVGVFPIGSANDFIKTLNPGSGDLKGIGHFFGSSRKTVDLGKVNFNGSGRRYFINSLGVGFTGRIARTVKKTLWLKGELSYVHALLSVLASYRPLMMNIRITGEDSVLELEESVFAFSVSNGKVEGGKFRIAPHAELTDGLLDVCILRSIPKYEFFRFVLKYLKGTHVEDPKVIYCKAKSVEITLQEPDVMHMDGEVYENISGRITISVDPDKLSFLSGMPAENQSQRCPVRE
ncbi:MAG: diacylglycerol kinase family lipid kinase [Chlorobiaceae bacterium]|nr:diacylglycerol kinase family lipid kinase [Chlorobiaceae bacterium]NTW10200.1 diacylglycerol kinase family lipid kinase [Chlorobiaceae bacterium]